MPAHSESLPSGSVPHKSSGRCPILHPVIYPPVHLFPSSTAVWVGDWCLAQRAGLEAGQPPTCGQAQRDQLGRLVFVSRNQGVLKKEAVTGRAAKQRRGWGRMRRKWKLCGSGREEQGRLQGESCPRVQGKNKLVDRRRRDGFTDRTDALSEEDCH